MYDLKGRKKAAVLDRGQANFRRLGGFEAKAKDFKNCPWGRPWRQGRPL